MILNLICVQRDKDKYRLAYILIRTSMYKSRRMQWMDACIYRLLHHILRLFHFQSSVFCFYELQLQTGSVICSALTCQVYFRRCCVIFPSWLQHMVTLHFPLSSRGAVNGDISYLHRPVSAIRRQAPCLHRRLSPVCKKRFCLYLQFVQAADIPAPPSPLAPNQPQISPGRFIAQHWQQQRGGFIPALSLKRAVTQPHSIISTSSDFALDTFNQVPSARVTTVFIKVMNHSGAWADLQVRTASWSRRLHEITIYDLHQHLYGRSWSLNDNWLSIFCLHRERGHIRFHRPSWIIAFPPLLLQKNGWSPANLVQHLKRMPSWHLSAVVWAFLRLAFSCSIWLRITNCCYYLLCSPPILFPSTETWRR